MRVFCRFAPPRYRPNEDPSCKSLHIALEDVPTPPTKRQHHQQQQLLTVAEVQTGASVSVACSGVYFPVPECTQERIFADVVMPILPDIVVHNRHNSVLAYGQTSTGKSHTILGPDGGNALYFDAVDAKGLVPRVAEALFGREWSVGPSVTTARVSAVDVKYFEIYNETACDLVAKALEEIYGGNSSSSSQHRGGGRGGTKMMPSTSATTSRSSSASRSGSRAASRDGRGAAKEGFKVIYKPTDKARLARSLQKITCRNDKELHQLLGKLTELREVQATDNNWKSSRSHVVIQLHLHTVHSDGQAFGPSSSSSSATGGVLTIVDLAGSESFKGGVPGGMGSTMRAAAEGLSTPTVAGIPDIFERPSEQLRQQEEAQQRIQETKNINTSLFALKKVVQSLASGGSSTTHIPYNDSMLTSVLANCLKPDSVLIVCCSSDGKEASETLSTLRFATEASKMRPLTEMVQNHKSQVLAVQRKALQDTKEERAERESLKADRAIHGNGGPSRQGSYTDTSHQSRKRLSMSAIEDGDPLGDGAATSSLQSLQPSSAGGRSRSTRLSSTAPPQSALNALPLSEDDSEQTEGGDEESGASNGRVEMLLAIIQQLQRDLQATQSDLASAKAVVSTVTDQFEELSADYDNVCGQLADAQSTIASMQERHDTELQEAQLEISCLRNELYLVDERGKVSVKPTSHTGSQRGDRAPSKQHASSSPSSSKRRQTMDPTVDPGRGTEFISPTETKVPSSQVGLASSVLRSARMSSETHVEDGGTSPRVVGISAVMPGERSGVFCVEEDVTPHVADQLAGQQRRRLVEDDANDVMPQPQPRRHQHDVSAATAPPSHSTSEQPAAAPSVGRLRDERRVIEYLKTGFLAAGQHRKQHQHHVQEQRAAVDQDNEMTADEYVASGEERGGFATKSLQGSRKTVASPSERHQDSTTGQPVNAPTSQSTEALEERLWGERRMTERGDAANSDEDEWRRHGDNCEEKDGDLDSHDVGILDPNSIATAYERYCSRARGGGGEEELHLASSSRRRPLGRSAIVGGGVNIKGSAPSGRLGLSSRPIRDNINASSGASSVIATTEGSNYRGTTTGKNQDPSAAGSFVLSSGYNTASQGQTTPSKKAGAAVESLDTSTTSTVDSDLTTTSNTAVRTDGLTKPPSQCVIGADVDGGTNALPERLPLNPLRQEIAKMLERPLRGASSSGSSLRKRKEEEEVNAASLTSHTGNENCAPLRTHYSTSRGGQSRSDATQLESLKPPSTSARRRHTSDEFELGRASCNPNDSTTAARPTDDKENYFRSRSKSPTVSIKAERQRVVQVFSPTSEVRMQRSVAVVVDDGTNGNS